MNSLKNSYLVIVGHFVLLALGLFIGSQLHVLHLNFAPLQNPIGDANWYHTIATEGYSHIAGQQSSTAFFPLYPFVWRFLGLSTFGITIFNFMLLLISLLIIVRQYKLSVTEALLIASSPGLFYCFLPFSEAVFMITSVLLLVGYKRDKYPLIICGLFLACLSRSAAVVFLPAVISVELMRFLFHVKEQRKQEITRLVLFGGACCVAVLVVAYMQWLDTGLWFVFAKAQLAWNRKFQLPGVPLRTWSNKVLFFDAAALIVGLLAGIKTIYMLVKAARRQIAENNSDHHFALLYLGFVTVVSLMFGAQGKDTTYINSLNRYVFCTGFFLVAIIYLLREKNFYAPHLVTIMVVVIAGLLATGYYGNTFYGDHPLSAGLDALAIILVFIGWYVVRVKQLSKILIMALYLLQAGLQLHFFELYLKPSWVG